MAHADTPKQRLNKFEDVDLQKVEEPLRKFKVYDASSAKEYDTFTAFHTFKNRFKNVEECQELRDLRERRDRAVAPGPSRCGSRCSSR